QHWRRVKARNYRNYAFRLALHANAASLEYSRRRLARTQSRYIGSTFRRNCALSPFFCQGSDHLIKRQPIVFMLIRPISRGLWSLLALRLGRLDAPSGRGSLAEHWGRPRIGSSR